MRATQITEILWISETSLASSRRFRSVPDKWTERGVYLNIIMLRKFVSDFGGPGGAISIW